MKEIRDDKIIDGVIQVVKANPGKKKLFYSTKALNPYGNQTSTNHRIETINKVLRKKRTGIQLEPYDAIKVVINIK